MKRPGVWRCSSLPTASGRCCTRRSAQATFRISIPRQIPSRGISRSSAPRARASSKRSRSGQVPRRLRMRARAVGRRVEVGAAAEDQRVEPVEQRVRRRGAASSAGSSSASAPAAAPRSRRSAASMVDRVLPGPPARPLERRADPDRAAAHSASRRISRARTCAGARSR